MCVSVVCVYVVCICSVCVCMYVYACGVCVCGLGINPRAWYQPGKFPPSEPHSLTSCDVPFIQCN